MKILSLTVIVFYWRCYGGEAKMNQNEDNRYGLFTFVKGKVLKGQVIEQRTVTSPLECGHFCIRNRLCSSFNYKLVGSGGGGICELNNGTRITMPRLYHDNEQYSYYFDPRVENSKSCLDYLRNGAKDSGIYTITDTSGDSYQVFCDLTSESGSSWTLIQSYALKNRRELAFCRGSFAANLPVNENSPNWNTYRLKLQRMKLLSDQSTHWRSTTGFEKFGVDYTDYMRGKISSFNILSPTTLHAACKTVEFVNIRGHTGNNTQVNFFQELNVFAIHSDGKISHCSFNSLLGSVPSENNFGYYCEGDVTMNSKFRGTMDEDSTTQWWFGSYL